VQGEQTDGSGELVVLHEGRGHGASAPEDRRRVGAWQPVEHA
jgi:hypothetical protein